MACARALLDLGATVRIAATTDRVHERATELGRGVAGVVGDLTLEDGVLTLRDAVGRVDVLVNNAGMTSVIASDVLASVSTLSAEDSDADLARNLRMAFLVTRAFLPAMVERRWGRIVNVASTTGPVNAMPDQASYAAAKAGMVGLTRAVAVEVAAAGVTCNAVAPGWIATGSQSDEEAGHGAARRWAVPVRRTRSPPWSRSSPRRPRPTSPVRSSWSMGTQRARGALTLGDQNRKARRIPRVAPSAAWPSRMRKPSASSVVFSSEYWS